MIIIDSDHLASNEFFFLRSLNFISFPIGVLQMSIDDCTKMLKHFLLLLILSVNMTTFSAHCCPPCLS